MEQKVIFYKMCVEENTSVGMKDTRQCFESDMSVKVECQWICCRMWRPMCFFFPLVKCVIDYNFHWLSSIEKSLLVNRGCTHWTQFDEIWYANNILTQPKGVWWGSGQGSLQVSQVLTLFSNGRNLAQTMNSKPRPLLSTKLCRWYCSDQHVSFAPESKSVCV